MSTPSIKLYYFDLRGFGEYIRLLLIDQKIPFEDIRIPFEGPEWESLKETMIFGTMPCLKIVTENTEKCIVQTGAILRHLGRVYGLNGAMENEETFLDMFLECVRDMRMDFALAIREDEATKHHCLTVTIPNALEKLQKLFLLHPGAFTLGKKITYVDYTLFEELDVYNCVDSKILEGFPVLKDFWKAMWDRENLKKYLEKRRQEKVWINGALRT